MIDLDRLQRNKWDFKIASPNMTLFNKMGKNIFRSNYFTNLKKEVIVKDIIYF